MDDKLLQQVFEELLPSLEALDTKCAAILQFLKNKGIATDDELAPYFEQAGNASSVRWRAARVRINHLLSTPQAEEKGKDKETSSSQSAEKTAEPSASKKSTEAKTENAEKAPSDVPKPADNAHEGTSDEEQKQTESASSGEPRRKGQKDDQSPGDEEKNAA